jgi:hypothetical protein
LSDLGEMVREFDQLGEHRCLCSRDEVGLCNGSIKRGTPLAPVLRRIAGSHGGSQPVDSLGTSCGRIGRGSSSSRLRLAPLTARKLR